MNDLQVFNSPEFGEIRTVELDGEPWFVGKDVAKALGYNDAFGALKKHVDDEDKQNCQNDSFETPRGMTIINESGVYSLIFASKLPKAKKFKRWVTSEVLPAIRRQGAYLTPAAEKQLERLNAGMEVLTARVAALEGQGAAVQMLPAPEGAGLTEGNTGYMVRRRWMRTMSEKLELLSDRFGMSNREVLCSLYRILERKKDASLDEERLRVMEERELEECSILTAIFYTPALREELERGIDFNLAPENRGW